MTRARQLLSRGHSGRAGTHDSDTLARPRYRGLRLDQPLREGLVANCLLEQLDTDRVVIDVQDACGFAGSGADAPRELREVVGGVQSLAGFFPVTSVHGVVPVGDEVAERTSRVAKRDPAVHAARPLKLQFILNHRKLELPVMLYPFGGAELLGGLAPVLFKACNFSHCRSLL